MWSFRDYSDSVKKVFGKMVGLWRCHYMLSTAVEMLAQGDQEHTLAFLVQCSKALHQTALDRGSWMNSQGMVPTPDPLGMVDFAGDEYELQAIHKHLKAVKELKGQRVPKNEKGGGDHTDETKDK